MKTKEKMTADTRGCLAVFVFMLVVMGITVAIPFFWR